MKDAWIILFSIKYTDVLKIYIRKEERKLVLSMLKIAEKCFSAALRIHEVYWFMTFDIEDIWFIEDDASFWPSRRDFRRQK